MYLLKRKFHNRACAKFDTIAMVFRNNENCQAARRKRVMSTVYKKNNNIHEVIKGREEIMPCYLAKEEEKNKKRKYSLQSVFYRGKSL